MSRVMITPEAAMHMETICRMLVFSLNMTMLAAKTTRGFI